MIQFISMSNRGCVVVSFVNKGCVVVSFVYKGCVLVSSANKGCWGWSWWTAGHSVGLSVSSDNCQFAGSKS